ncbi:hypothetical protein, partial [Tepidibacter formicigenes]
KVENIENRIGNLESKVDELIEFKDEANKKLDYLVDSISILEIKEKENEVNINKLKNHLKAVE